MVGGPLIWIAAWLAIIVLAAGLRRALPAAVKPMLLAVSLLFYWLLSAGEVVPLLIAFAAHACALLIVARREALGWLAVIINLAPLVWFKLFQGDAIPLGLSFLTFLQISAVLDIRGGTKRLSVADLLLYALFFGSVAAGPITRYNILAPQIARLGFDPVASETVLRGLTLGVLGLCKISLIGQPLQQAIDPILLALVSGGEPSTVEAAFVFFGGFLALYFLFSGYSDIAIGTGLALGLRLALNFNSPFKATNPSDFIDRWHMSLTLWVKTYIFSPIVRYFRKRKAWSAERRGVVGWAAASFASLVVIGAWHSIAPAFLVSGVIGGALVVTIGLLQARRSGKSLMPAPIARSLLLGSTLLMTIIYQTPNLADARQILMAMVDPSRFQVSAWVASRLPDLLAGIFPVGPTTPNLKGGFFVPLAILTGGWAIALFAPNSMQISGVIKSDEPKWWHWRPNAAWGLTLGLAAAVAVGVLSAVRIDGVGYEGF